MTAYTGDILGAPRNQSGHTFTAIASDTIATPATADTITFSDFWPANSTPRALLLVFSSPLDTNASPGTFTAGDGSDADGFVKATSMGNLIAASGTAALMGTELTTATDLVLTLGTIGTAGSAVIVQAFGIYEGGDTA